MWGPLPRPDLIKYFRGIILPEITSSYKPNDKCYTVGKLQLYAPTMSITAHGPPLCVMQTEQVCVASKALAVDYMAAHRQRYTSEQHNQAKGHPTVRKSMPPKPQLEHDVGIHDLQSKLYACTWGQWVQPTQPSYVSSP